MKFEDVETARQKCETKDEETSKKRRKAILITCAIIFPLEIIILLLYLKPSNFSPSLFLLLIPIFLVFAFELFLISTIVYLITWKDTAIKTEYLIAYKRAYKAFFISQQLAKFFTDIHYDHTQGLDRNLLKATGLIYTGDIYKSNDLVKAKYKNTDFLQADVEIIEKQKDEDSNGEEVIEYVTVFKGRYLIFAFPKKFDFKMTVSYSGKGSSYINPKTHRGLSRIETESTEFNKRFLVYAEDGFEAFYILNPSFIDNLEKIGEKYNNALSLYFSDNKMYVGLNNGNDTFEPPNPAEPLDEKAETAKVIEDMKLITALVDELKLSK